MGLSSWAVGVVLVREELLGVQKEASKRLHGTYPERRVRLSTCASIGHRRTDIDEISNV